MPGLLETWAPTERTVLMGRLTAAIAMLGLLVAACGAAAAPAASSATPAPVSTATPAPVSTATPAPVSTAAPVTAEPTATPLELSAAIAFDGQTCTYAGPKEIPHGASMTFSLANTPAATKGSRGAALVVTRVVDGTTWDQVVKDAKTSSAQYIPSWVILQGMIGEMTPESAAAGKTLKGVMTGNLYFVGCATAPEETDRMFPGVLLQVVDQ